MKTKLLFILILLLFLPFHLFSQEEKVTQDQKSPQQQQLPQQQQGLKRVYEFGLKFINLDNFGFDFKIGNQKTLYRMALLHMGFSSGKTSILIFDTIAVPKTQNYGVGLRIGMEKRIVLVKNFDLHLGSDVSISYQYSQITWNVLQYPDSRWSQWELSPAILINIGLSYQVGEHFIIIAEFSPDISYTFGKEKEINAPLAPNSESTFHHFSFGLNTSSVSITIAYRILKTVLFKW